MSNEDGKSMGLALILPLLLYIVYLIREIRVSHHTSLRQVRIAVLLFITLYRPRTAISVHVSYLHYLQNESSARRSTNGPRMPDKESFITMHRFLESFGKKVSNKTLDTLSTS